MRRTGVKVGWGLAATVYAMDRPVPIGVSEVGAKAGVTTEWDPVEAIAGPAQREQELAGGGGHRLRLLSYNIQTGVASSRYSQYLACKRSTRAVCALASSIRPNTWQRRLISRSGMAIPIDAWASWRKTATRCCRASRHTSLSNIGCPGCPAVVPS